MDGSARALMGTVGLAVTAVVAFAVYRWLKRKRVRRVEAWVKGFLSDRYGEPRNHLHIDCSDDPLWPVLVVFDDQDTGTRHRLQFSCSGPPATFSLLSEKEHQP